MTSLFWNKSTTFTNLFKSKNYLALRILLIPSNLCKIKETDIQIAFFYVNTYFFRFSNSFVTLQSILCYFIRSRMHVYRINFICVTSAAISFANAVDNYSGSSLKTPSSSLFTRVISFTNAVENYLGSPLKISPSSFSTRVISFSNAIENYSDNSSENLPSSFSTCVECESV